MIGAMNWDWECGSGSGSGRELARGLLVLGGEGLTEQPESLIAAEYEELAIDRREAVTRARARGAGMDLNEV